MKKIMLVDDAVDFLLILSNMLKKQFEVFTATGVQEAFDMLDKLHVDAICSDLYMDDGTGVDLLQALERKDLKIPFILMSGSEDNMDVRMAKLYGAIFIPKNNTSDLLGKIKEVIHSSSR